MRREFTLREKILIIVLAVIIIGVCYYYFFLSPLNDQVASYRSSSQSLETDIQLNSAQVLKKKNMQAAVDELKANGAKSLPKYDNSRDLIIELHDILKDTVDYTLKFGNVAKNDYMVSRPAYLSIATETYDEARAIIDRLYESDNIMIMGDVSISIKEPVQSSAVKSNGIIVFGSEETAAVKKAYVTATMQINYFEADLK